MIQNRILVVDDDATFLDSIDMIFSAKGFDVTKLSDPKNIFDTLEEAKPDIILLDVSFPGNNGFDVLNKLKAHCRFSSIPVIMMTADVTVHIDKAFAQGADDCVFKPLDAQDIIKRVSRLIQ
ncbi:MAG: response regulator [Endomicrobium sp.]|jgi:PleD family two-component response regulator|nr:response regulator [Endomicrobium sp.]